MSRNKNATLSGISRFSYHRNDQKTQCLFNKSQDRTMEKSGKYLITIIVWSFAASLP